jgi:UDP-3-O-[3-hydroxymyristoyl] glucosamine N-acyltransferase
MPSVTIAELARRVGGTITGDVAGATRTVTACNTLMEATPEQVSLLHNAKYAKELETTRAGCVIVAPGGAAGVTRAQGMPPLTILESPNAYYAWQKTMLLLHGYHQHAPVPGGISPQAVVHPTARIGKNVQIHASAVIGENVEIGDNTYLYPHVTLMENVRIGSDTVLYPNVTVYWNCIVGNRCLINAGTVIGSDGFSYAQADGIHHKMPQTGNVTIEDDVEIGSNSIVERAALKTTTVGRGSKIGNCVVVGHNCIIGPGNLLISQVGIAGSTNTGKYVVMAGQVGVNGHLDIPDFVRIGAQAGVMVNPEPNTEIAGSPAMEATQAKRMVLNMMRLPELAKRVKELEKQVEKLSPKGGG